MRERAEIRKQKATACFCNRWKNIASTLWGEVQNCCSKSIKTKYMQHTTAPQHSEACWSEPNVCVCVRVCVSIAKREYIRTGNNISWALVSWLFFRRHVSNIIQQWKPSLSNALIWWHNGFFDVKSNILIVMCCISFAFMCSVAMCLRCYFGALDLLIRQFFRILAVFFSAACSSFSLENCRYQFRYNGLSLGFSFNAFFCYALLVLFPLSVFVLMFVRLLLPSQCSQIRCLCVDGGQMTILC